MVNIFSLLIVLLNSHEIVLVRNNQIISPQNVPPILHNIKSNKVSFINLKIKPTTRKIPPKLLA